MAWLWIVGQLWVAQVDVSHPLWVVSEPAGTPSLFTGVAVWEPPVYQHLRTSWVYAGMGILHLRVDQFSTSLPFYGFSLVATRFGSIPLRDASGNLQGTFSPVFLRAGYRHPLDTMGKLRAWGEPFGFYYGMLGTLAWGMGLDIQVHMAMSPAWSLTGTIQSLGWVFSSGGSPVRFPWDLPFRFHLTLAYHPPRAPFTFFLGWREIQTWEWLPPPDVLQLRQETSFFQKVLQVLGRFPEHLAGGIRWKISPHLEIYGGLQGWRRRWWSGELIASGLAGFSTGVKLNFSRMCFWTGVFSPAPGRFFVAGRITRILDGP